MASKSEDPVLGKAMSFFFLAISLVLAFALFVLRGGFNADQSLDSLARRSLDPEIALWNGQPTVFEFYADWCEACKSMTPDMIQMEKKYENRLDVVLLNVDNQRWQDLIDQYQVNGIPQLNFFGANGDYKGKSIGVLKGEQLLEISDALINDRNIPDLFGPGPSTQLNSINGLYKQSKGSKLLEAMPRSHG